MLWERNNPVRAMIRTKPKSDKVLTIRLPEKDLVHLERYCAAEGRTKTEVLRQLIQNLPTVPD
ncbi:ribbon-helix-helix protein, CopG family [Synechocystis salina LEGE 06155]|nr:ribbon-helix-helix protein, CopG family [Synechocystis salina LEGE 06155]